MIFGSLTCKAPQSPRASAQQKLEQRGLRGSVAALCLSIGFFGGGCDKPKDSSPPPAVEPSAQASAEPAPPPKPWYEGHWLAEFNATHHLIDMKQEEGGVHAWKIDDGTQSAGKGVIRLDIDEHGAVSGGVTGALGELSATGLLDEDVLSVQLTPIGEEAGITSAFFQAKKNGEQFDAELQASSGDSLKVRKASFVLAKGEKGAAPPPAAEPAAAEPTSADASATADAGHNPNTGSSAP